MVRTFSNFSKLWATTNRFARTDVANRGLNIGLRLHSFDSCLTPILSAVYGFRDAYLRFAASEIVAAWVFLVCIDIG